MEKKNSTKKERKTRLHGPLMKQSDTKEKDLTGPAPTRVGGPKCKTKQKKKPKRRLHKKTKN